MSTLSATLNRLERLNPEWTVGYSDESGELTAKIDTDQGLIYCELRASWNLSRRSHPSASISVVAFPDATAKDVTYGAVTSVCDSSDRLPSTSLADVHLRCWGGEERTVQAKVQRWTPPGPVSRGSWPDRGPDDRTHSRPLTL